MEEQVTLKKVYGDVFFTARRMEGNAFIYAQWYGVQSVETGKEGGYKLLEMMQEKPCASWLFTFCSSAAMMAFRSTRAF